MEAHYLRGDLVEALGHLAVEELDLRGLPVWVPAQAALPDRSIGEEAGHLELDSQIRQPVPHRGIIDEAPAVAAGLSAASRRRA